jgi:hypothetical protein
VNIIVAPISIVDTSPVPTEAANFNNEIDFKNVQLTIGDKIPISSS